MGMRQSLSSVSHIYIRWPQFSAIKLTTVDGKVDEKLLAIFSANVRVLRVRDSIRMMGLCHRSSYQLLSTFCQLALRRGSHTLSPSVTRFSPTVTSWKTFDMVGEAFQCLVGRTQDSDLNPNLAVDSESNLGIGAHHKATIGN
jgi:hypothetical protein